MGKYLGRTQSELIRGIANLIETLCDLDQQESWWLDQDSKGEEEVQSGEYLREEATKEEDSSRVHEGQDHLTTSMGLVTTPALKSISSDHATISFVMDNLDPSILASSFIPPSNPNLLPSCTYHPSKFHIPSHPPLMVCIPSHALSLSHYACPSL